MKRGFTLVELLVVVAMIALIMGSLSVSISSGMQRARIQKATSDVKMISQAILAYENYAKSGELTEMKNAQADKGNLGFLLGSGEKSEFNQEVPILLQAALTSQGVMRDPWGEPYLVTIRKGQVTRPDISNFKTGYYLPNFYRLTEDERK